MELIREIPNPRVLNTEIKFKFFDKVEKQFYLMPIGLNIDDDIYSVDVLSIYGTPATIPVEYVDILRYTGKKDVFNNEIYENDIVKSPHTDSVTVTFKNGSFFFGEIPAYQCGNDYQIVGNIYENQK